MVVNVELDGQKICSESDLHDLLHRELFPEWDHYGRNFAALWDVLTSDVPRPVKLTWVNARASAEKMGAESFGLACAVLAKVAARDFDSEKSERFEFELR